MHFEDSTLKQPDSITTLPDNSAIWIYVSEYARHGAVSGLVHRILEQRPDLSLVLTSTHITFEYQDARITVLNDFQETTQTRSQFFASFAPHVVIWVGGSLSHAMMSTFQGPETCAILADAHADGFALRKMAFLPNPDKRTLQSFDAIFPIDQAAQNTLAKLGIVPEKLTACGAMQASIALDQSQEQNDQEPLRIGSRNCWYAAQLSPDELPSILRAHQNILRLSHSTLLLLAAQSEGHATEIAHTLSTFNLRGVILEADSPPDANIQVGIHICDRGDDIALYRAASVSFLGHSLLSGQRGTSPTQAAAVGSANCYGPNSSDHSELYSKLAQVGGARMVNDADSLAQAVGHMLTASNAATMALNAWSVMTEGAEITDHIVDLALGHLDEIGI